jgi:hypothetical protein
MKAILALTLGLLGVATPAQWTQAERLGLAEAMVLANLNEADLGFERRTVADPEAIAVADAMLSNPLAAAEALMAQLAPELVSIDRIALAACGLLGDVPRPTVVAPSAALDVPPDLKTPLESLVAEMLDANKTIAQALSALSPSDQAVLADRLPTLDPGADPRTLSLLRRVDVRAIRLAGVRLAARVTRVIPALRQANAALQTFTLESQGLKIVIGGAGDDLHNQSGVDLCIDLGGRDTYVGRYAGGIARAAVVIDLGGADTFEGSDVSMGAGVLGIGLLFDLDGNGVFRTRNLSCGAAVGGFGLLMKEGGNDTYTSGSRSQGFGLFGVGILCDTRGSDRYQADPFAQGAGLRQGVGWLIDREGDDTYRAATMAQGAADAGIGWLSDLAGNDVYIAESWAQGAGTQSGLGALLDGGGRDLYTITRQGQAYGNGGSGCLFDLAGDDLYTAREGDAQATAEALGVALLLDREGNDAYLSGEGGVCQARAGGLAIFVESGGNDHYTGSPGRPDAGAVLFADLAGTDRYDRGLDDSQGRPEPAQGGAVDLVGPQAPAEFASPNLPRPGTFPAPDEAAMRQLWARCTGVESTREDRRLAFERLVGIGVPALAWGFRNGHSDQHAFRRLARELAPVSTAFWSEQVASRDDDVAGRALRVVADAQVPGVDAAVRPAFARPALRRWAAAAAQTPDLVPELLALAAAPSPLDVRAALQALTRVGDRTAASTALALLESPDFLVRLGAMRLLARFPEEAEPAALRMIEPGDERKSRRAIDLLGMLGTPTALDRIGALLDQPSRSIRIGALGALDGRVPEAFRARVDALRRDPDPLVRGAALRIDLGR